MAHVGTLPAEEAAFWILLVGIAWLFLRGLTALRGVTAPWRRLLAFAAAFALLAALVTPAVDEAADALFSAHMAQHMVLILALPILLVYSRAVRYVMMGLPRPLRRFAHPLRRRLRSWSKTTRLSTVPAVAVIFAVVLWSWHLPVLYDAAVANGPLHLVEHVTILVAGLLFWDAVMDSRRGFLPRSMLVFGTAFHCGLLGALLALAPEVLYRSHLEQALVPLTPLHDQQLAGLIMWIPMGVAFLATLAVLLARVLGGSTPELASDA